MEGIATPIGTEGRLPMNRALARMCVTAAGLYGRRMPFSRGKMRLINLMRPALAAVGHVEVASAYGTRLHLESPEEPVCVLGNYETGTSRLCAEILLPGDIAFHIGANIGWYTSLFHRLVGSVHAFEPIRWILRKLRKNCDLNSCDGSVHMTSLRSEPRRRECRSIPFTESLMVKPRRNHLRGRRSIRLSRQTVFGSTTTSPVAVSVRSRWIKADVEGGDLAVLNGGLGALSSSTPPMLILEVNFRSAGASRWHSMLCCENCETTLGYAFIRIASGWGEASFMHSVEECVHSDNVLACVSRVHEERIRGATVRRSQP